MYILNMENHDFYYDPSGSWKFDLGSQTHPA